MRGVHIQQYTEQYTEKQQQYTEYLDEIEVLEHITSNPHPLFINDQEAEGPRPILA